MKRIMRAVVLTGGLLAATPSAFGIGATQEWVRRHITDALSGVVRSASATNIVVSAEIPAAAIDGGDTNCTYLCTIHAGVGTHAALRVETSTVPEVPAGTFFAYDGEGGYVNCSNSFISTIYARPYTLESVSTNALGTVLTNSVSTGYFWATDSTNGTWRMAIDGDNFLYLSGDRSRNFSFRSTTLPERAAAVLLPSPQSARLSVRDLLSLIVPTACARTAPPTYTIRSGITIAINTIAIVETDRITGETTTRIFTPDGLDAVYSGPSGPFESRDAAEEAASSLENWNFSVEGNFIYSTDGRTRLSMAYLMASDVWEQLLKAVELKPGDVVLPPHVPDHPCPLPRVDDIYDKDTVTWEDMTISLQEASKRYWVRKTTYTDANGNWDDSKLDPWRGQNGCVCEFEYCEHARNIEPQHRVGRVKVENGEKAYSDDADGSDGCKCCIRCARYGSDAQYKATLALYDDHRRAGDGAERCGCFCSVYNAANIDEWPGDLHNHPLRTAAWPNVDYSCMCYCEKQKALAGDFVRHMRTAGDSPWCHNLCVTCGLVEDQEKFVRHSYLAFDTRYATLRTAEWKDHTPRSEADVGVSMLNDPNYYKRCGCACGVYDTKNGDVLPSAYTSFHQQRTSGYTCLCFCGQTHAPNRDAYGGKTDPYPCPDICAVCQMVEDETANQSMIIDGHSYPKLVMRIADQPEDHTPSAVECGCMCGDITSETTFESPADTARFHSARNPAKECTCVCGAVHTPDPEAHGCGGNLWVSCKKCNETVSGEEGHSFPGSTFDGDGHSCECGDKTEPHGALEPDGERTYTYNSKGQEDGWVQSMLCAKGCGYSTQYVHKHHFVNCGVCDAGDDCDTVCTGCNGAHVFNPKDGGICSHCGCEMSGECTATPDDIAEHSGWEPCGEDAEDDNDWIEAKGGHCRCECRKFGHVARTQHDYQLTAGLERYEQCTDDDREVKHYYRLGTCTRCGQHKKQKQAHDFPDDPTEYKYKSDEICRWAYLCQCSGCDYIKYDDEHGHTLKDAPSVFESILVNGAPKCRWKYECEKCHGYIKDDTHDHERDKDNECRCKKLCGYQFEHNYITDACGNESCSHCKAGKNGVAENHSGYTDAGDVHKCACGRDEQPHVFGSWVLVGTDSAKGILHYEQSCSCGKANPKDEPCAHSSFGGWAEIGRGGGVVTYSRTCGTCGFTEYRTLPDSGGCDTNLNHHVAAAEQCGCQCGKYGPSAEASTDINLHKWAETVNADGVRVCLCLCGRYHEQRGASTSLVNRGRVCGDICAYCKEKSGTGLDVGRADDSLHTPCEERDGHCGCKCGALTHGTNIAKFHIRKSGTCRCLGSGNNDGTWHFRMVRGDGTCQNICACTSEFGGEHIAAKSEQEPFAPRAATVTDHTKASISACGCECRKYYDGNWSVWSAIGNLHNPNPNACGCFCGHGSQSQVTPYHRKAGEYSCECMCSEHKIISHVWNDNKCTCNCIYHNENTDPPNAHRKINLGKCLGVCRGECGEYLSVDKKNRHTPHESQCGCECRVFEGPSYPGDSRFHKVTGGNCICDCGQMHLGFVPRAGCPKLCGNAGCDWNEQLTATGADIDLHDFGNRCVCGCGSKSRPHKWSGYTKAYIMEYVCGVCGNNIRVYDYSAHCTRNCNATDSFSGEEGHDESLHNAPGGEPAQNVYYCETHQRFYVVECPDCAAGNGGSGGGGNGSGQESGGYDDLSGI